MTINRSLLLKTAALACLFTASIAQAGVIRHDRNDALYTGLAAQAQFAAVGDMIINNSSRCSGTAISDTIVLTAAHCLDGGTDATTVTFTVGGSTYTGTELAVHQNWTGDLQAGWDIALLEVDGTMNVDAAQLYGGAAELGKVGTNVGFGTTGTGLTGYVLPSGTKRAGNNVIDVNLWSSRILAQDFDNPNGGDINLWGGGALDLEYLIAPGDSGGGMFIEEGGQWYVAGVHSFIASADGVTDADYGDAAGSTRVSSFLGWIADTQAQMVPAPATIVLLLAGLLGLRATRR